MKSPKRDRAANARDVLSHSAAEVITAIGAGQASVADAASISDEPQADQRAAAAAVRSGEARTLREAIYQQRIEKLQRDRNALTQPGECNPCLPPSRT